MAKHNTLSRRLYRILLRSCRHGVADANKGNTITSIGGTETDEGDGASDQLILLQPPMDQRKYGFAKVAAARRGYEGADAMASSLEGNKGSLNSAVGKMSAEEVGMAMEVLRFVHVSLRGNPDDDLVDYYLGSVSDDVDIDEEGRSMVEVLEEKLGAAAGRHAEGHYTQFLDEDEERGEGDDGKNPASNNDDDDGDDGDDDDQENQYPEWDSDDELEEDESVLVTSDDLQNAARIAFRAPLVSASESDENAPSPSKVIARRHRDAIDACSLLSEQFKLWGDKSSVAVDIERAVRVVATSSLMMRPASASGSTRKYRFCYRIRVENIADVIDAMKQEKEADGTREGSEGENGDSDGPLPEYRAIQLLGRTWNISERGPWHRTSSSVLRRLLEEGVITDIEDDDDMKNDGHGDDELRVVQTVNEPRTGAVGLLPVLGPGEVFEYMSGADIATPAGAMEGCFHMAAVDMQSTDGAQVGDQVEALTWRPDDERRFEAPVGRFGLVVDDTIEVT